MLVQLNLTRPKLCLLASFFYYSVTVAQTNITIDSLEVNYQRCLDRGVAMHACAQTFYYQMDSMLNVYYFRLQSQCNYKQKEVLRKEELLWLSKRDIYFKKTMAESKKNINPSEIIPLDNIMIMYDSNAQFVKARVIELSLKKPNNY